MATKRIVFITGGNNGIGYEAVKALLQSVKPFHILMGSRSLEKASSAIDKLHNECPESANTVEAVQVDLTSDKSIDSAFGQVKSKHGYIDVLVNNAGLNIRASFSYHFQLTSNRCRLYQSIPNRRNISS